MIVKLISLTLKSQCLISGDHMSLRWGVYSIPFPRIVILSEIEGRPCLAGRINLQITDALADDLVVAQVVYVIGESNVTVPANNHI